MTVIDQNPIDTAIPSRHLPVFFLLAFLICSIYSNSLNSSWHFDDNSNILNNQNIHLETLNPSALIKSLYLWDNSHIYRPVTNLSFALNWFVGKDIVTGYHLVNILIHILTAFFLYLVVSKLLNKTRANHSHYFDNQFIALISTALWAANPIHVQAITFIVQRATSLSALFSIITLYTYIQGREKSTIRFSVYHYSLCFLCFLLALGSKENAILLPGSIVIIDFFFLRQTPIQVRWKNLILGICSILLLLICLYFLASIVFIDKISLSLFNYAERSFTLNQRILTEPRVLLFYLSQIAYPLSSRLSLEHDVVLSTSILQPWTTLPSIIFIFFSIALSLYNYKKYIFFSFAIIFYFYNHTIESTILPLEIIFEHRNYLPSFFLFPPIILLLTNFIESYSYSTPKLIFIFNFFLIFLLFTFGMGTYSRNLDWKTKKILLIDTIAKAPNQARPYHNLASHLLTQEHDVDGALALYKISLSKQSQTKHRQNYQTYTQIAKIYTQYKNDHFHAIPVLRKALAVKSSALTPRLNLSLSLIATGEYDEALQHIELLLQKRGSGYLLKENETISRNYLLNLKSLVLLKKGDFSQALPPAREAIHLDPNDTFSLTNLGFVLSKTQQFVQADTYLTESLSAQTSQNLLVYFMLLENSIKAGFLDKSNNYARFIIDNYPIKTIFKTLQTLEGQNIYQPANPYLLRPAIIQTLQVIYNDASQSAHLEKPSS